MLLVLLKEGTRHSDSEISLIDNFYSLKGLFPFISSDEDTVVFLCLPS